MNPSPKALRLHSLDALRASALLLGVLLHAAMAYLPGPGVGWAVQDRDTHPLFGIFVLVVHSFRLEVFFLLAGFFGRMMYFRLGARGFTTNRLLRIAVPLVFGWFLVYPFLCVAWVWGSNPAHPPPLVGVAVGGTMVALVKAAHSVRDFPLTHLWFLYYLGLIYAAFLALRQLGVDALDRSGRGQVGLDALVRRVIGSGWGVFVLALLSWPLLLGMKNIGVDTPDKTLVPHGPTFVLYGSIFGFGWLLQRQVDLIASLGRRWRGYAVLALIASLAAVVLVRPAMDGSDRLARAAFQLAYALMMCGWTLACVAGYVRFRQTESLLWRYLADASYWVYIIHLPAVALLQVWLSRVDLSCWAKFGITSVLGLLFSLVTYQLFVRSTPIGLLLNGHRHPFVPWRGRQV